MLGPHVSMTFCVKFWSYLWVAAGAEAFAWVAIVVLCVLLCIVTEGLVYGCWIGPLILKSLMMEMEMEMGLRMEWGRTRTDRRGERRM